MQFVESSGKVDGKVAPGLHRGSFRGSQKPFTGVPLGKIGNCIFVNMQISSEVLIGLT